VLSLSVDNIHCFRVTGDFHIADDNMSLGGVTVDTVGNVNAIAPFDVGSFSQGTDRGLANNPFATFTIETLTNWPKAYQVFLVLAERHSGGVYDYVFNLADQIRTAVINAVTQALGTVVGSFIGTVITPGVGTGIGAILGWAAGWVIGWVVNFVINNLWAWLKGELFSDDIFVPALAYRSISAPGETLDGSVNSKGFGWTFNGFGGEYLINAHWSLTWGAPNVNACWHVAWEGTKWSVVGRDPQL
jgi:hypothetical protein